MGPNGAAKQRKPMPCVVWSRADARPRTSPTMIQYIDIYTPSLDLRLVGNYMGSKRIPTKKSCSAWRVPRLRAQPGDHAKDLRLQLYVDADLPGEREATKLSRRPAVQPSKEGGRLNSYSAKEGRA